MSEETCWFVRATITRWVDSDPQPGIVECVFDDAAGRRWSFIGKYYDFTQEELGETSAYPQPGYIACGVTARGRDEQMRDIAHIDTDAPERGRASEEGASEFDVLAELLIADALSGWEVVPLIRIS